MNNADKQYIELCKRVLKDGNQKDDRTGTGTRSIFGAQMRFDLSEGFPLLTTKEVHFHSVVGELLWFLRGDTNIKFLQENGIKIWNAWAADNGEVGELYGGNWRNWRVSPIDGYPTSGVDQIGALIDGLQNNPDSRRHLVSAWNVDTLPIEGIAPQKNVAMGLSALACCHYSFQCYVSDGKLSLLFNMRSSDVFLGLPFNIASYALLTHMLAQVCRLEVGELIWSGGDVHIYNNHVEQVKEQIRRFDGGEVYALPTIELDKSIDDIDDFDFHHFKLHNYKHGLKIKGEVAV